MFPLHSELNVFSTEIITTKQVLIMIFYSDNCYRQCPIYRSFHNCPYIEYY